MGTPSRSSGVASAVRVPVVLDGASGTRFPSLLQRHGRESFADQLPLGPLASRQLMGCKGAGRGMGPHRATITRPSSVTR